jgi:hypothetical protein
MVHDTSWKQLTGLPTYDTTCCLQLRTYETEDNNLAAHAIQNANQKVLLYTSIAGKR